MYSFAVLDSIAPYCNSHWRIWWNDIDREKREEVRFIMHYKHKWIIINEINNLQWWLISKKKTKTIVSLLRHINIIQINILNLFVPIWISNTSTQRSYVWYNYYYIIILTIIPIHSQSSITISTYSHTFSIFFFKAIFGFVIFY